MKHLTELAGSLALALDVAELLGQDSHLFAAIDAATEVTSVEGFF